MGYAISVAKTIDKLISVIIQPVNCPECYHAGYTESGAYNIGKFTADQ